MQYIRLEPKERLLTLKETMDFLHVSRSTVYRFMWDGTLQGYKVGVSWRFRESDVLRCVRSA